MITDDFMTDGLGRKDSYNPNNSDRIDFKPKEEHSYIGENITFNNSDIRLLGGNNKNDTKNDTQNDTLNELLGTLDSE